MENKFDILSFSVKIDYEVKNLRNQRRQFYICPEFHSRQEVIHQITSLTSQNHFILTLISEIENALPCLRQVVYFLNEFPNLRPIYFLGRPRLCRALLIIENLVTVYHIRVQLNFCHEMQNKYH